jgi:hypothetical protein
VTTAATLTLTEPLAAALTDLTAQPDETAAVLL